MRQYGKNSFPKRGTWRLRNNRACEPKPHDDRRKHGSRSKACRSTIASIWLKRLACFTIPTASVEGSFSLSSHQRLFRSFLGKSFYKSFHLTEAVREPIADEQWKLLPPATKSNQPLVLMFPKSLDWARCFGARSPSRRRAASRWTVGSPSIRAKDDGVLHQHRLGRGRIPFVLRRVLEMSAVIAY